jgi:hypothetical protein
MRIHADPDTQYLCPEVSPCRKNPRSQPALSILCEESEGTSEKKQLPIDSALTYMQNKKPICTYYTIIFVSERIGNRFSPSTP